MTTRASASEVRRPLRVLHVVTSCGFAGIERHVVGLLRELRALGCAGELACPPSAGRLRAQASAMGIPVHPSADARSPGWLAALALHGVAPADVVHVHDGRAAAAVLFLSPPGGTLLVRTQHFTHPASVARRGWRGNASIALHRALNRRLGGYVAVSRAVADAARDRRDAAGAALTVIPPGIEPPHDGTVARAKAARSRAPRPVVAFVGRLEAEKRLDVLLHAVPQVLERLPACRFVIAGAGKAGGELRRLAGELGVGSAIEWMGEVPSSASVLEGAHVYVNPSPGEGFGLATAEAMGYALPVVAVASGGSAELVEEGATGLLVPPDDAGALAAAIARLAGDRSLAAQMGAVARGCAQERYGIDRTARATLAFYRHLRRDPGQ